MQLLTSVLQINLTSVIKEYVRDNEYATQDRQYSKKLGARKIVYSIVVAFEKLV